VNKEILRLAIPNIISNLSIPILSTVDTILMGHLSAIHLGAVGIGSMVFNFIYWNFGFLRMGTTGLTAQAYGESNVKQVSLHLYRSVLIAIVLSVCILLLYFPIQQLILLAFDLDPLQGGLVIDYFKIRIIAAPATLLLYVFMGWYFGIQNALVPLLITVIINVINAILSYAFVVHYQMDIYGVALGTVVAQYLGLFSVILIYVKNQKATASTTPFIELLRFEELKSYLSTNLDLFIRTLCLTSAFGFFYSQSSAKGELFLGASVILLQLINWMSYGIDGFAHAAESIVGKYAGAKNRTRVNTAIKLSFVWGSALALLYTLIFYGFSDSIIPLFTNDESLITFTNSIYFWIVLFPLVSFASYIWDGVFIGLVASKEMRNSMLIAFLFFICFYYALSYYNIGEALWISFLLFMIIRGLVQSIYFLVGTKFKKL